jgi:hypothetical protein
VPRDEVDLDAPALFSLHDDDLARNNRASCDGELERVLAGIDIHRRAVELVSEGAAIDGHVDVAHVTRLVLRHKGDARLRLVRPFEPADALARHDGRTRGGRASTKVLTCFDEPALTLQCLGAIGGCHALVLRRLRERRGAREGQREQGENGNTTHCCESPTVTARCTGGQPARASDKCGKMRRLRHWEGDHLKRIITPRRLVAIATLFVPTGLAVACGAIDPLPGVPPLVADAAGGRDGSPSGDAGRDAHRSPDAIATADHEADTGTHRDARAPDGAREGSTPHVTFVSAVTQPQIGSTSFQLTVIDEAAGDLLVAAAYWTASAQVQVSDTAGNTWSSTTSANGAGTLMQIWYAPNVVAASSNTVTVAVPVGADAGNQMGAVLLEYAGVARMTPLDGLVRNFGPASLSPMTTGSFTTTGQADLLIGLFADLVDLGEINPGTGFAREASDQVYATLIEDNPPYAAPPGSHDLTATLPTDAGVGTWAAIGIAFKAE